MTTPVRHIVLYGSLRRGQPDFKRLRLDRRLAFVDPVSFPGRMYDLGDYPGVVLSEDSGTVRGELYEIRDQSAIEELDAFEAYRSHDTRPYDPGTDQGSLFIRRTLSFGGVPAFLYELNAPAAQAGVVTSGDWVRHRRRKAARA